MIIRPPTQADFPAWSTLWDGYLAFYEASVAPGQHAITFSRLLSNDPHEFHARLAEENGQLLGLVHYLFHRHGWHESNVVYLQDLFVLPEARGQGIARRLIETVYQEADQAGAASVYWLTQDFNTTARQLYDKVANVTPFIKYQRPPSGEKRS